MAKKILLCLSFVLGLGYLVGQALAVPPVVVTTEHFMIQAGIAGTPNITASDKIVMTGKTSGTFAVGAGADECGTYYNGSTYEASATFTGVLTINPTNYYLDGGGPPTKFDTHWVGTSHVKANNAVESALYKEDAADDSECIQDFAGQVGARFVKYESQLVKIGN